MGWTLKDVLSDPSMPKVYSVRRFTCPHCFFVSEIIFYSAGAMDVLQCDNCEAVYCFSHKSRRLFNWDKSKALPETVFEELNIETILRA